MRNYGEELVCWYLRLNGFFIIDDFVIHKEIDQSEPQEYSHMLEYSSDTDVLAIRLPYAFEKIGGSSVILDNSFFDNFGIMIDNNLTMGNYVIGLICEVKTGRTSNSDDHFILNHVERALGRLGLVPPDKIRTIAPIVKRNKITASNDSELQRIHINDYKYKIGKILFSAKECNNDEYINIKLADVDHFIRDRLCKYGDIKYGDRMLFPSSLIQYLSWGTTVRGDSR